jgi:hypothetical protein
MSGTTLSFSVERPDVWKVVRKKDGRMLITANWKLSKDGNMLADNFSEISPNGSTSTVDYVYERKGQGSGQDGRDYPSTGANAAVLAAFTPQAAMSRTSWCLNGNR